MRPALIALLYCALLAPNIWATISPFEDWPYTNAPMFGHYVDEETPRYRMIIERVDDQGERKELGYWSVGASWSLMRFFFKWVYGSADQHSVFNTVGIDSPEEFQQRLTNFLAAFAREYQRFNPSEFERMQRIDLSVARLKWEDDTDLERHLVGSYDQATGKFQQRWGIAP